MSEQKFVPFEPTGDTEFTGREPDYDLPPPQPMEEEHILMPPELMNNRALETYNLIRAENPWLPDPNKVSASKDLEITFGVNTIATITLTMYISLPEVIHDRPQA